MRRNVNWSVNSWSADPSTVALLPTDLGSRDQTVKAGRFSAVVHRLPAAWHHFAMLPEEIFCLTFLLRRRRLPIPTAA
jgi:hypothetical protein